MQVISSFSFASGATLQSLGVKSTFDPSGRTSSNKLTFTGLLKLFTIPKWLLGLGFVFLGAGIHLYALTLASVTVVQPVGILAVPWSVLLASKIHGHKIPARIWKAVGITIIGVFGFTWFSSRHAVSDSDVQIGPVVLSFVIVLLLCGVLAVVASKTVPWAKAMLWSSVGAMFYGLASGMMKAALDGLFKYSWGITDIRVWGTAGLMLVCYVLGVWMIQQGYASGPAEITVGTMTTVDPFVAVLFGLFVLKEGAGMGTFPAIGMAVTGAIAIYGV
ncbi:MAG: hypothetical protein CR979_03425, partial [Propionibacterium sp.]